MQYKLQQYFFGLVGDYFIIGYCVKLELETCYFHRGLKKEKQRENRTSPGQQQREETK